MELCCEGLKQFYRLELGQHPDQKEGEESAKGEQQAYFVETEYHVLRQGKLPCFLPVQLREQDGSKTLYYDVTGRESLREVAGRSSLSGDLCRMIVKGIILLFDELEANMLEADHVSYDPGKIYYSGQEGLQWMYLPDSGDNTSLADALESLFSWMLAGVDYDDGNAVKFVYQVFWRVRRQGCTKEVLQRCLLGNMGTDQGEIKDENTETGESSEQREDYDAYFGLWDEAGESPEPPQQEKRGPGRQQDESETSSRIQRMDEGLAFRIVGVILVLSGILACLGAAFFGFLGLWKGFTDITLTYFAGCLLGGASCLFLGVRAFVYGRQKKADAVPSASKTSNRPAGPEDLFRGAGRKSTDQIAEAASSPDYEDLGKTVLLSSRREDCFASLRALDSGELFLIRDNPYHIGSGEALNHLVINSSTISRQHAVICYNELEDCYLLQDMGSTNGSFVDHMQLSREQLVKLKDGCHVRFAQEEYVFSNPQV